MTAQGSGVKSPDAAKFTAEKSVLRDRSKDDNTTKSENDRLRSRVFERERGAKPADTKTTNPAKTPVLDKLNSKSFSGPTATGSPKTDAASPARREIKTLPTPAAKQPDMSEIRRRLTDKKTDFTKTPDVSKKPDFTGKPDLTKKPDFTKKPDDIKKPDFTGKPDFTKKPDFSKKPDLVGPPKHDATTTFPRDSRTLDPKDAAQHRFTDRYKAGELDHLAKGEMATKLKLNDQYKMLQQGDVARRLDLHKGTNKFANVNNVHDVSKVLGPNYRYMHGPVHPSFAEHSFQHAYWGHHWFGSTSWYPHWNPWVAWSWHHHCNPFWDPRPYWCRPIFYDPCPAWVYWDTPAFVPLPAAACGTWVDVERPVLPADQADLQLLAVRFVDPGHPEEKLGPRYRVWFRNNSTRPVAQPFNVVLFAANDNRLVAGLPQAGVRVTSIEASETQSVDLRLPVDVYTMGRDATGNPAPFSTLHALVDANREVTDITRTNNGAPIARAEILPVDPAAFEADPKEAAAGGEIVLAGEGFGPQPGQVLVNIAGQEHEAEILGWYDLGVRLNLPKLTLTGSATAEAIVVRGDGAAANPVRVTITP